LEDQITIIRETTSHENNRRGRRPLRVGSRTPQDFFSRLLAQATRLKLAETPESTPKKRPTRD
jgi:hypothetical protein